MQGNFNKLIRGQSHKPNRGQFHKLTRGQNNLKMEFLMNFEKTSISTKVRKFLQDNLKDEKDKESLLNIISEKTLLKMMLSTF